MKNNVLFIILFALCMFGCTKDDPIEYSKEPPFYALDTISLKYMPYDGSTTLVFVNNSGEELRLHAAKGIEIDTVWNYNRDGTSNIFYNEFRRIRFTGYNPDNFYMQLLLDIGVMQTKKRPYAVADLLSIAFWDDYTHAPTGYFMDYQLITSARENTLSLQDFELTQVPVHIPDLELLGYNFTDVFKEVSPSGLEMYCAKGQGIVAFKDLREYWVLLRVE